MKEHENKEISYLEGFEKTILSHLNEIDQLHGRLKQPSKTSQLIYVKGKILKEIAKLHVSDVFVFDEFEGGELLITYFNEKFEFVRKQYEDILKLLDFQINHIADNKNGNNKKPERIFADYLKHPKPEKLIVELKNIFPNAKGKEAAIMVFALNENKLIARPKNNIDLIKAIRKEWNIVFSDEAFNRPFRELERGYNDEAFIAVNKVKQTVAILLRN